MHIISAKSFADKQEENQHLKTEIKKLLEDLFEAKTKNNALHEGMLFTYTSKIVQGVFSCLFVLLLC